MCDGEKCGLGRDIAMRYFFSFGWLLLISVAVLGRHTPLPLLERGDWGAAFFLKVWGLSGEVSPLERGDSDTYFLLKVSKL